MQSQNKFKASDMQIGYIIFFEIQMIEVNWND